MPRTLYLIDAYAQIFRAYYAIRGGMRSAVTGEPTHAVFGVTSMLLKLLGTLNPDFVAVATDTPGSTFRDDLFPDYKGTRRETPDDLISQIPRIFELIEAFGIPVVGRPELEADDIIASITQRVLDDPALADVQVRIASKDKDLEQLLCERVCMYDIQTDTLTDGAALLAAKGVTPAQVIDLLTLTGDSVDNVPGVDGIGPKTAAQLLQQFGSLDGIYANLGQITGKRRENLDRASSHIALSKTLVTLKRDGEFPFSMDAARVRPPDLQRILPILQQLGFQRFQDDVKKLAGVAHANGIAAGVNGITVAGPALVAAGAGGQVPLPLGEAAGTAGEGSSPPVNANGALPPTDLSPHPPPAAWAPALPEGEGTLPSNTATAGPPPETAATGAYTAILTRAQLDELAATLAAQPLIAVDTETTGLERDAQLCGLSFSWERGHGVYVPVRSPEPERHLDEATVLAALKPVLESDAVTKTGHNVKFDAAALLRAGVRLRGVVFDSMLASLLLDPSQPAHKLDHLALTHLNYLMVPITDLIGQAPEKGGKRPHPNPLPEGEGMKPLPLGEAARSAGEGSFSGEGPVSGEDSYQKSMADVPLEQIVPYAAEDADMALRLYGHFAPRLAEAGLDALIRDVEAPLTTVLAEMEHNGILCDPAELARQGQDLGARVEDLRQRIFAAAGQTFTIDSPKQLAEVLFDKLGLTPGKKTKTGRSTDVEVLEKLAAQEDRNDPRTTVPRLVLDYRQLNKLISTYLGNLREAISPRDGRIHTTFHQLVAATGRLASQHPNLQNIPVRSDVGRLVRKAFPAAPGHLFLCADYSQIELRVLAHFSEDPALLEAFDQDQDIHAAVAAQVFGVAPDQVTREQRNHAKTINFGIIYGVTAYGLARRIEGLDNAGAAKLIADYKQRFPGIETFLQHCIQQALDQGYVTTILGRRRAIPEIYATNFNHRALGERLAINSVVQGSAADLIKVAMINVQRRLDRDRLPARLLLQIHDELVLETPVELAAEHARIVREEMERAMTLRVPLKAEVGIGPDWFSAK